MIRQMIKIEEDLCNGCGLCATACHEGAITIINGKAKIIRDDYCDGLGNCLPVCPTGAISFEEREALDYDEEAVKIHQKNQQTSETKESLKSELLQWPVQIKLVPVNAPYFENANLLIAADCTAYAYANFHEEFMKKHITIIGCPKLDEGDYSEKLAEIIKNNRIKSVKVLRMEVPCCGGLEHAVIQALKNSGKMLPWQVVTISCDGQILE
ncbi:MAG TPA: 4Fe-4S binding protein [Lachnospiraceae bacterium]|nr:4Fe-4S binding protein [Lachnospiraceae bacterium]